MANTKTPVLVLVSTYWHFNSTYDNCGAFSVLWGQFVPFFCKGSIHKPSDAWKCWVNNSQEPTIISCAFKTRLSQPQGTWGLQPPALRLTWWLHIHVNIMESWQSRGTRGEIRPLSFRQSENRPLWQLLELMWVFTSISAVEKPRKRQHKGRAKITVFLIHLLLTHTRNH